MHSLGNGNRLYGIYIYIYIPFSSQRGSPNLPRCRKVFCHTNKSSTIATLPSIAAAWTLAFTLHTQLNKLFQDEHRQWCVALFVLTHPEGHLFLHHTILSWLISECQWFLSWGNPEHNQFDSPNMNAFIRTLRMCPNFVSGGHEL